ncbi:hypothetical protein [Leifsonia sp. Leaf264]|nr:hypothetical protein [Leifsonia sp. Leaf264]
MTRDRYEPLLDVAPEREYEEQMRLWQELAGPPAEETIREDQ